MNALRLAASAAVLASFGQSQSVDFELTPQAKESCHVVSFSAWGSFRAPGEMEDRRANFDDRFRFRVTNGESTRFLVRRQALDATSKPVYANRIYALDLVDARAKVRRATEKEWEAAYAVGFTQNDLLLGAMAESRPDVEFNGHRFVKSGQHWSLSVGHALLAPDRRGLALMSWTGGLRVGGRFDDNRGEAAAGEPTRGQVFVDFYDTETATKRLTVRGRYRSDDPGEVFARSGWLMNRFFIMPAKGSGTNVLVCDLH